MTFLRALPLVFFAVACSSSAGGSGDATPGTSPDDSNGGTTPNDPSDPNDPSRPKDPNASSSFTLTVAAADALVAPGHAAALTVRLARTGTKRPVTVTVAGLGGDLAAAPVTIPAEKDEATLTFEATKGAPLQAKAASIEATDGATTTAKPITVKVAREMLDPKFGAGGTLVSTEGIADLADLRDGRLVVSLRNAANDGTHPIRIYDAKGAIASTFSVAHPVGGSIVEGEGFLAVQPDGKLLYGTSLKPTSNSGPIAFAVARFAQGGTLDTTFGEQGWARVSFPGFDTGQILYRSYLRGLALEADGGIVLAGDLSLDGKDAFPIQRRAGLARFTAGGQPDAAFGTGGTVVTAWNGSNGNALGVRATPSGTYVFGYGDAKQQYNRYEGRIARVTPTGALEGILSTTMAVRDVLVTPASQLLVTYVEDGLSLVSPSTGALDTSVNKSGFFSEEAGGSTTYIHAAPFAVIDADQRILALMGSIDDKRLEILAYGPTGAPLKTYGGAGRLAFATNSGYPTPLKVLPMSDGRVIVAGVCNDYKSVLGSFYP